MDSKKVSILSAIAASSCCLLPLILLGLTFFGIGTAGVAGLSLTLGSIKWYILPLAIVGVGVSYYLFYKEKKKCRSTACKIANETFTKIMLTISTIVVVGFTIWSFTPFLDDNIIIDPTTNPSSEHLIVYKVDGMTCGGCEIAIDEALEATGLIDSVKSSSVEGKAYVWHDKSDLDLDILDEAIKSVGYKPQLVEIK